MDAITKPLGSVATDRRLHKMKPKVDIQIKVSVASCLFGIAAILALLI